MRKAQQAHREEARQCSLKPPRYHSSPEDKQRWLKQQAEQATARRIARNQEFGLFYIYAMADPRTGRPYYVGRTTDPANRLVAHWSGGLDKKRAITSEIRAAGLKPVMVVLERVGSMTAACAAERKWINAFDDLTNTACYDSIPFYSRTLRRSALITRLTPRR